MSRDSLHKLFSHTGRHCVAVAMLICCLPSVGCNWHIPRGEGFQDEMSGWSRHLRNQEKSDGTPLGTSEKALEIERNLGYR